MQNKSNNLEFIFGIIGAILTFSIWLGLSFVADNIKLPSPLVVFSKMFTNFRFIPEVMALGGGAGGFGRHLISTIYKTLIGALIGIGAGIGLGLAMGRNSIIRDIFEPIVSVLRIVPPLIAVPFLLMWFGTGIVNQVGLVALYCFFCLVINTLNAVINIPPVYRYFASSLGASENQIFRTVVLPAIIPELIGGIRVTLALSWGLVVAAELLGAAYGIGKIFSLVVQFFATDLVLAGTVWITIVAISFDQVIKRLLLRMVKWMPREMQ